MDRLSANGVRTEIDADQARRFTRDVQSLIGPLDPATRLALAVSGGSDSLAMLLLAHAAFPGRIHAATVDHGLRAEAAAEARAVETVCRTLHVPHATLRATVEPGGRGLQAEARAARYHALGHLMREHGLTLLLTAHHLDDQAETLLMRLARGSGAGGLAGVRARVRLPGVEGTIVRPLLAWRRSELAALVGAAGLQPAHDPSNADPAYDRARFRAHLATAPWLAPEPLARAATFLAQAEDALTWTADRLWAERTHAGQDGLELDSREIPPELVQRLLRRAMLALNAEARPRGDELHRLAESLAAAETRTLAGIRCEGGPVWRFSPAPPRRA